MELSNKAAYIKGLMEGMKIDETTDQGKVLKAMAELMEEMAKAIEDVTVLADETVDVVDSLSDDLSDLEDDFYDEFYGDDDDEDYDYDPDDDTLYECVCPMNSDEESAEGWPAGQQCPWPAGSRGRERCSRG